MLVFLGGSVLGVGQSTGVVVSVVVEAVVLVRWWWCLGSSAWGEAGSIDRPVRHAACSGYIYTTPAQHTHIHTQTHAKRPTHPREGGVRGDFLRVSQQILDAALLEGGAPEPFGGRQQLTAGFGVEEGGGAGGGLAEGLLVGLLVVGGGRWGGIIAPVPSDYVYIHIVCIYTYKYIYYMYVYLNKCTLRPASRYISAVASRSMISVAVHEASPVGSYAHM